MWSNRTLGCLESQGIWGSVIPTIDVLLYYYMLRVYAWPAFKPSYVYDG